MKKVISMCAQTTQTNQNQQISPYMGFLMRGLVISSAIVRILGEVWM